MNSNSIYPLAAVQAVIYHTHGLTTPNKASTAVTRQSLYQLIEKIGCVQIDALQMVHRSHYMIIWSRIGNYEPSLLDSVVFGDPNTPENDRLCFEYWYHAACILPLTMLDDVRPRMLTSRESPHKNTVAWLAKPENQAMLDHVRQRIKKEGGLRTSDFKSDGKRRGPWWDWKPAKRALEYLFNTGELMIADRQKFQRVYDLPQRVLPEWVTETPLTADQGRRRKLEKGLRVFGVCKANQLGHFTHMTRTASQVQEMIDDGTAVPIEAQLTDGQTHTLLIHKDNLPLLEKAMAGDLPTTRTTFMNPFDSLWYAHGRDEQILGFKQTLEAYKPKGQYIWGYFSLPILYQGRLIGRFDPKLERKTGVLRLKSLHLEPGVVVTDEMVAAVAATMRDFLAFHQATDIVVEDDKTDGFGQLITSAL